MSRYTHIRQQQQLLAQQQQQMADNDAAAAAAEMFDMFCLATTMRQILGLHRNMCDTVGLRPAPLNEFYPKLKAKIRSWKAQALWKKFDARAAHRAYSKGNACTGTRVLVIGAGPCGLRTAIEAQLLGAKVVVVEKRDRISRNNVLHLWPFVITDLRNLGAKKFYGKFCAGSIDHISIRQLQCILLKVALLLGVEIHEGVSFERTIEPSEGCGWRAAISPEDHAVSHYEFDVLIGADGKRNTLEAFKRKEFRGKLAIAITANFINKKTEAEAKAEEISGVAFIFNQTFFKELYHTTGIDLENIVYYKDETHYFVMTAKKHSLIDKGVILQDFADPAELLAPPNVNTEKLLDYAREAAEFSTKYQMPNLEFAVNHYGKPDVAMFDFTSMFAAESSCRVIVRKNYRLLQCLVGDSLLEPFWPTGSGCARGFLSSMDAAYAIKLWNNPRNSILGVLAQRESIYRLLAQTTPENLQRDIGSYTVDPATRYPNLNRTSVNVWQVKHLIDCDDKSILEQTFMDTNALQASQAETPIRRKRRTGDTLPLSAVLLRWIKAQLHSYEFTQNLNEVSDCFTNGKVLCALINRYRPDLVDFNSVKDLPPSESNDLAFKILDKELKISRVMSGKDSIELDKIDSKIWLNYLEQICEVFRGEIPHVKHPKLDVSELREKNRNNAPDFSRLLQMSSRKAKSPMQDVADTPHVVQRRSVLDEEKVKRQRKHESGQGAQAETPRRAKKRRSAEKTQNIEERQQRLKEIEANRQDRQSRRRMQRFQQTQNFYKSLHMLQVNTLLRESDESSPFEDYSIYMYRQQAPVFNDRVKELERKLLYPDRERGISSAMPRGADEQFSDRIKSMEQRITSRNAYGTDKKPKDLLRAIGKIDSNDWNVREIEKKIEQSKKTETGGKGREKVPKWSKEQFVARQSKMSKPTRQDSGEEKFKEIDQTLKNLDKQLKEGSVLEVGERGKNKVASIAGQFVKKDDTSEEKNPPPIAKSNSKVALAFKKQAASEKCHFCKQTVYLMEKISTEGLILHRSCLKCHHCHTNLRLGGYAFDRDDPEGRFYCTQHFRLPAKAIRPVVRKPGQRKSTAHGSHAAGGADAKTPEKPRGIAENVVQLDLLDRGQTPERIEFENTDAMSDGEPSEEHIIDENEWSGRNFLQPSADSESDLMSSSDESDEDSDSDMFEEANGSPIAQQTLQLATDWIGKQHYSNVNSDDSDDDFYDSSEGLIDDGKDDTEGEEFKKAREMRREEVRLLPLPTNLPTDTETENQSQVVGPQDGIASAQKTDDVSSERVINRDADKISLSSRASDQVQTPSKADIEKIEQNSDRRFSADVDAISEKLYRLNNLMKMNKDIESMAKENLVKSDILKKLSLKEKWLLDNSVSSPIAGPHSTFDDKVKVEETPSVVEKEVPKESAEQMDEKESTENSREILPNVPQCTASASNGDDDRGDGLQMNPAQGEESKSAKGEESESPQGDESKPSQEDESKPTQGDEFKLDEPHEEKKVPQLPSEKMEIEGILDIVKLMDTSYIEPSKEPLPSPKSSPKSNPKDAGKMLYDAEHKNENRLGDALHQIEVKNFAGTMDTIKSQMVTPTISHQGSLDISKYFPNAKQEKQTSGAVNKNQKTLKDVDLTKYFPQSPVPQRKTSVTTVADRLKKSQTEKAIAPEAPEPPKAPPRRQKSMAASTDKTFSIHEHLLDGAIDIQKAPVVKPVAKKGIKIVKKIVPKGTKAKKAAAAAKKPQDEADKILDEILQSGQDVRSPSVEYQKLFTEEKSPSEDVSEKIEKILEETGIDLGLPPKPKKKLLKAKSLGEEEFKRTQEKMQSSKEDGDRPSGVQRILQRFESMSSIKSDESFRSKKSLFSSTCSLNKSRESLRSKESLVSNTESVTDLEKTMEYLKSEWRTEATNFLQQKRESFFASRKAKPVEEVPVKRPIQPEPQWKETKYSKFFGIKEKSPEKRKSPTKKRKSPAKMLKKSPREEILKHRQKVESVSSRRASFEEKIKEEEARLKAEEAVKVGGRKASIEGQHELQNGHGSNGGSRRASLKAVDDEAKPQEVPTRIPISQSRKDTQTTSVAEKLLSRRGSGTSGLADVLKPPVVKGARGPQARSEEASGSKDALKAVLSLMRQGSQTSVNGKDVVEPQSGTQSRRGSKTEEVLNQIAKEIKTQIATSGSRRGSQAGSSGDVQIPAKEIEGAREPVKLSSRRPSQTEAIQSRRGSQTGAGNESLGIEAKEIEGAQESEKFSSRRPSQTETTQGRRGSQTEVPNEKFGDGQIHAKETEASEKILSRKNSEIISDNENALQPKQILSRRASEAENNSRTSQPQSRRGSQKSPAVSKTSTPLTLSRKNSAALEAAPAVSRRSSNISVTLDDTITVDDITDVDEIFNEIVSELDKSDGPVTLTETSNLQQELVAIASELVEEDQPSELQQIDEEFKKITNKRSRSSSEDSIEKLFSEFTDDMLVDVEFDSNDEVVAITPRAVLVNENDHNQEEQDESDVVEQKHITIEEAKLKFEPLFPGQQRRVAKSSSSSMSTSPRRTENKARTILKKLDPADMAPSVQDVMQKIIPREESEPNDCVPVAFPRFIYESGSDDSPRSSGSRTQTPETEKDKETPKKKQHLEVVYELAWPARKRMPSPVPESARPPMKPVMIRAESTSRRSSNSSIEPKAGVDSLGPKRNSSERSMVGRENNVANVHKNEVVLTGNSNEADDSTSHKGSKVSPVKASSVEQDATQQISRRDPKGSPQKSASVEQEATRQTPRRDSRGSSPKAASVEQESSRQTSRRVSNGSPPNTASVAQEATQQTSRRDSKGSPPKPAPVEQESSQQISRASSKPSQEKESSRQTSRRNSKDSLPKAASIDLTASQSNSRRGSKTSIQDESIVQRGSPALLPTPRRGSRTSIDGEKANQQSMNTNISQNESPALPSIPRRSSTTSNDVQGHEIESSPRRNSPAEISSDRLKTQSQSLEVQASQRKSPDVHVSTSRRGSKVSPPKTQRKSPEVSPRPDSSRGSFKIQSKSPERNAMNMIEQESKQCITPSEYPSTSPQKIESRRGSMTSRSTPSKDPSKMGVNGQHKSSVSPSKASLTDEPNGTVSDESKVTRNDQSSHESMTTPSDKSKTTSNYESPNRTSPQRIDVQASLKVNEMQDDKQSSAGQTKPSVEATPPLTSSPIGTPKSNSPITVHDKFPSKERSLDWDMSKIPSSARNSREKLISSSQQEPSKEYKDLLRSKLESPSVERRTRNPSRSKEPSLEWDMEQLPRSPMPRRKYVDSLLNDKENSLKPTNIPSPSPARTVVAEKPLPTKRLEEWEIIEQLERERRLALIKRDENYTNQIHENSSKTVSWQPAPTVNRLESLEEPQSSKLIEYIKQQTLADSSRQKDDSPKPPSRPRTPQQSKASTEDLNKQVEALLKTQEPKPVHRRPQMQKTESTEATYEDFARFTRRSVDEEPDTEPVAHHRLSNHRQKSPESASGTYSPTSSLSKSTEHLAPSRPHRNKPTATSVPEDRVDRETKYLIDRSKHLRNMKRDFMEEKIAGNNPYLKKVIEAQKVSRDSDEEDDVDYALESYRPKNHTTPRFPTSSSITGRRRREPRYPDYTSTTSDYSRRAYSPHYSTASTSAAGGSRNFVDYFKRSPPHYKTRESSKDSCVIS